MIRQSKWLWTCSMGGSSIHRSHPNGIADLHVARLSRPLCLVRRTPSALGSGTRMRAQRLRSIVKMKLPSGLRLAPSLCVSEPSCAANVKGAIAQRDLLIVHDHLNRASAQPALHFRKVGSTLLSGAEEAQIVAARLQDRDVCSVRHILVDAAKHHRRSV